MRGQPGYTIVETLAALAILSVTLLAFYTIGGTSLRAVRHVGRVGEATLLARSKLDEIANRQDLLESNAQGSFAGTPYAWTISANKLPDTVRDTGAPHLQDITLTITWHDGVNEQSISVVTRHLGRGES